ncbi:hypothetical protein [Flavimaricola marinus]|uniref:Uncharacterized protein n=1 Tax=Flavimaricola marinus TaxID=1819565 RepID=A0A238LI97_9RHOB|nr:hypothetical protein [Flavimaricola marinus]SMY09371.1 hypothetical protein LOM8899_03537 [Flavimaricola marinus]
MRIALALALLPGAAFAQVPLALPQGCDAYVTIQMASCTVSHSFTCADDPEGVQRRVDLDEEGVTYFGAIDAETQWLESTHIRSGHSERLAPDPADPASFTALLSTGVDNFDFVTLSEEVGPTRYVGGDSLTGETVQIDGVTLDRTRYSIRAIDADGTEMWASEGYEYIHRDWRMFLSGLSTFTVPDGTFEADDSPVEFIFPGEPGFLSPSPKHGCGVVMSSYAGPVAP